jgi:Ca2+-binding EF-hand superfamily protein
MTTKTIRTTVLASLTLLAIGVSAAAHEGKECEGDGKRDPAAFIKRFDKNGDGKLEVSELPDRMRTWLGAADTNKDGVITTAELAAHRAAMDAERRDPNAMIKRFDANGDGRLALSEVPERMREHLASADTDGNGYLSVQELTAARDAMEQARFAREDKNGDGALTEDEVGARGWAHLKVADTDGNGKITLAEIDRALDAGTLHMPHFHHGHGHGHDAEGPAPTES